MKICIVIQSDSFRQSAGMRIRYDRMRECLSDPKVTLDSITCEDLLASKVLDHDVYVFCKTFDTRALVLARRVRSAGKVVGQDLFDDYFSQISDPRLERFRQWMRDMAPVTHFAICSTQRMAEVLREYLPGVPITPIEDPIFGFDPLRVGGLSDAKTARARDTRELDIAWFGIGENPFFPVGLADLAASEPEFARMERLGWKVRLRIVTNRRPFEAGGAEILRGLGLPYELVEWTEDAEREALASATVAILPVNGQSFSQAKSLNRSITALNGGCQVLNLGFPLYAQLDDFIYRSTTELLTDIESGKCRLRGKRIRALAARFAKIADPFVMASAFVGAARHAIVLASGKTGAPRLCLIHGRDTRIDLHKMAMALGGISATTVFNPNSWNFRVRFDCTDGEMVMRVTPAVAERFALAVCKSKPPVQIGDFAFLEVDLDSLTINPPRISRSVDLQGPHQIALYETVIRFAQDCCRIAFGPADVLVSDLSPMTSITADGGWTHARSDTETAGARERSLRRVPGLGRHVMENLGAPVRDLVRSFLANPVKKQRYRAMSLLEGSQLFDRDWYLKTYPDVAASGVDPLRHYLETGWREFRDPGPGFSTKAYLRANPDVAAEGMNPLLHFVEHGRFEERRAETSSGGGRIGSPENEFGSAAPCAIFRPEPEPTPGWKRAGQLRASADGGFMVGDKGIGTFRQEVGRLEFEASLAQLARLSGASTCAADLAAGLGRRPFATLVDAWHVGASVLRSRWHGPGDARPFVVRVLQQTNGGLQLVGENLIASELDVVDARLVNVFFPIVFVFTDSEGEVFGWQPFVFPSLCRGGLHFAELLALDRAAGAAGATDTVDVCRHSERLADQLLTLLRAERAPLVSGILVDLSEADGTHPLFQRDFRDWLSAVARVPVEALEGSIASPSRYLSEAVRLESDQTRSGGVRRLILPSHMIPSISALVSSAVSESASNDDEQTIAPFVSLREDPSEPATLVRFPLGPGVAAFGGCSTSLPHLNGIGPISDVATDVPMALSMPGQTLAEAEWLVPLAGSGLEPPQAPAATWLIWPKAWVEEELLQSLESLAAQDRTGSINVSFVGSPPSANVEALASKLLDGRIQKYVHLEQAVKEIASQLVGYVGPGVILHDKRTVAVLATLLDEPGAASASTAIVTVTKRGKRWAVTLGPPAEQFTDPAVVLPRATWPARIPARDLWLTRKRMLAQWLSQRGEVGGRHLCTSLVTASYCATPNRGDAPIAPPLAEAGVHIEALV